MNGENEAQKVRTLAQGRIARQWPLWYRIFCHRLTRFCLVFESGNVFIPPWALHTADCLGFWLTGCFRGRQSKTPGPGSTLGSQKTEGAPGFGITKRPLCNFISSGYLLHLTQISFFGNVHILSSPSGIPNSSSYSW